MWGEETLGLPSQAEEQVEQVAERELEEHSDLAVGLFCFGRPFIFNKFKYSKVYNSL